MDTPKAAAYFAKVAARNQMVRRQLDGDDALARQQLVPDSLKGRAYLAKVTKRNQKIRATLDREEELAKQQAIAAQVPATELRRSERIAVQNAASYSNQ